MDTPSKDIVAIAYEIRQSKHANKTDYFRAKYPAFYESYPTLFRACVNPAFPLDQLAYMLRQRERLKNNELNLDESDKEVYEVLKEKYVYPVLDKAGIPYDDKK